MTVATSAPVPTASTGRPLRFACRAGALAGRTAALLALLGHDVVELGDGDDVDSADLAGADAVVLSGPADDDRAAALAAAGGAVVVVSPWGRGPRHDWPASAGVIAAAGGWSAQIGHADGPPVTPPAELAWELTAVAGALAALLAVLEGPGDDGGRRLYEVAAVDVVAATLETGALAWIHEQRVDPRPGRRHPLVSHQLVPAADGWVATGLGGNPTMWDRLVEWLAAEGEHGLADGRFADAAARTEHRDEIAAVIARFCAGRPARWLGEEAQRRRIPWATVTAPADVPASEQLVARKFFDESTPPGLARPPWVTTRSEASPARLTGCARHIPSDGPLGGVTILDLTWVLAGPFATRILADHGADVIKIESRHRSDPTRFSPAMHLGRGRTAGHGETSGYFANHNRNKRSMTLNLRHPDAMSVLRRLIAGSDVVIDNFSAGQLTRWGLTPEALWEIRPDLVVVEMSGMGQTGPWRDYVSYADAVSALSGLTHLTRDADGEPLGVVFGLADLVAGYHGALATVAALVDRRADGRGRLLDLSQLEAMVATLAAGARAVAADRIVAAGDGRWVAVGTESDGVGPAAEMEDADEIAATWRRRGVAAAAVADGRQLTADDATMRAVPFYLETDHPVVGPHLVEGDPIVAGGSRPPIRCSAPLLGADTADVLRRIGRYTDAEIDALTAAGVLE